MSYEDIFGEYLQYDFDKNIAGMDNEALDILQKAVDEYNALLQKLHGDAA